MKSVQSPASTAFLRTHSKLMVASASSGVWVCLAFIVLMPVSPNLSTSLPLDEPKNRRPFSSALFGTAMTNSRLSEISLWVLAPFSTATAIIGGSSEHFMFHAAAMPLGFPCLSTESTKTACSGWKVANACAGETSFITLFFIIFPYKTSSSPQQHSGDFQRIAESVVPDEMECGHNRDAPLPEMG